MKPIALMFLVVSLAACSVRPKQWIGVGLMVATAPVNLGVQSQPTRIGATFALLATALTMFELDARRDQTGEYLDLVVVSRQRAIVEGDYVQEECSPNTMICMGPYLAHRVESVHGLLHHRYQITTKIVATIPDRAVVHRIVSRGPAEILVIGDAWSTVQSQCELGCAEQLPDE